MAGFVFVLLDFCSAAASVPLVFVPACHLLDARRRLWIPRCLGAVARQRSNSIKRRHVIGGPLHTTTAITISRISLDTRAHNRCWSFLNAQYGLSSRFCSGRRFHIVTSAALPGLTQGSPRRRFPLRGWVVEESQALALTWALHAGAWRLQCWEQLAAAAGAR